MIPQYKPTITQEDIQAVCDYMQSGGWLTEHIVTRDFEKAIADYVGSKHCVVTNNGTISLSLMLMACGIRPGDEVIVPNYTMIATPNAVKLVGATPVFVDVERDSLCMNLQAAKNAITSDTMAVLFVTPNGNKPSYPVEAMQGWCEANRIFFLEDAAQSMGCSYRNGDKMGSVGLCGSYSFSPHKIVTTGQGGAIVTNNTEIYLRIKALKDFGRQFGGIDVHETVGYNFKFTDLQASIGLSQIKRIDQNLEKKQWIASIYEKYIPGYMISNHGNPPWFIQCQFDNRDRIRDGLDKKGVQTRLMYPPINKQLAYKDHDQSGEYFEVSEYVGYHGLWLPSYLTITEEEIVFICKTIKEL